MWRRMWRGGGWEGGGRGYLEEVEGGDGGGDGGVGSGGGSGGG